MTTMTYMSIALTIYLSLGLILGIVSTKGIDFEERWHKYDEFGFLSHIKNKRFFVLVIIMLFGIPYILKMIYDALKMLYDILKKDNS